MKNASNWGGIMGKSGFSGRPRGTSLAVLGLMVAIAATGALLGGCSNPIAAAAQAARVEAVSPRLAVIDPSSTPISEAGVLVFPSTSVGTSRDYYLGISNSGQKPLAISLSGIQVTSGAGTDNGNFVIVSKPSASLAPGESSTMQVRFSPSSGGTKAATLAIPSNDIVCPLFCFALSGTGSGATLSTASITTIASTTASGGGTISDTGGWTLVSRGICWNTSPNPTISDSTASDGGTTSGAFTCGMTGLSPGTLYYVRTYASNDGGITGYGAQVSFTTLPAAPSAPSVASTGIRQLTATWASVAGASSYDISYNTINNFSTALAAPSVLAAPTTTSAIFSVPADGTIYYVWVAARNVSGPSPLSVPGSCTMVGSVSLSPTSTTIRTGSTGTLVPTVSPASSTNQSVTWSSSDTSIASVDSSGVVTAINPGNVTIKVTTADQLKTANCAVTVSPSIRIFGGTGSSGFSGDNGPATSALISSPQTVALDSAGNIYFVDVLRIRKIDTSGTITTVAGTGSAGFSGDGGLATSAMLSYPQAVAVDSAGNLYISDRDNKRIRKVDASTKVITTLPGSIFTGSESLHGIAVHNSSGDVYVAATGTNYIYKITNTGVRTVFAGSGTAAFSGDGNLATSASLNGPYGVFVSSSGVSSGEVFIADSGNCRIRKVSTSGYISTVAGDGSSTNGAGVATATGLSGGPDGVAVDLSGNIFISGGDFIKRVDHLSGYLTNYAGSTTAWSSPANSVSYNGSDPIGAIFTTWGLAVNPEGTTVYFADTFSHLIWKVH